MKKSKLNNKLVFNKEIISNLNMAYAKGGGVPTQYENLSEMLTYMEGTENCYEICNIYGTHGLCTDELGGC